MDGGILNSFNDLQFLKAKCPIEPGIFRYKSETGVIKAGLSEVL